MRRGRVRELTAVIGALAVTLALMVWGAWSAAAGGPTSVLVASPVSTETASLYYSDEEYLELEQLLGPPGTGIGDRPPEVDVMNSRQINVTWLVHDVSPWRFDRVYPASDSNAVWIHTATQLPELSKGYWHRAERPGELRTLFKELGVMGKPSSQGNSGIRPTPLQSAPEASDADTEDVTTTETAATPPGSGGGTDWWWAIPGLAAGAVLALVLRPFASQLPLDRWRRAREPGPRRELRDV